MFLFNINNIGILTLTSSSVAGSDCGGSHVENGGDVDVVPFLLLERMSAIINNRIHKLNFHRVLLHLSPQPYSHN